MIGKFLRHPLFKSSLIYTVSDGINKSIPFFILPILSHYLLPGDYGIVSNFGVLTGIIGLIINCSVDGAISVNFYKTESKELKVYIFNCLLVSFSIFILVLISTILANSYLYQLLYIPFEYQLICVVMCFFNLFTTINLVLWRLEEKPVAFGLYDISNTAINISLSLLFVVAFKENWIGRINAIVIATIGYGLFSLFFLYKRGYVKITYNPIYFRSILLFGVPLIPHALSFWLRSGVDRIFISNFWGTSAVGLYATGFQFGTLVSFMILAFNNAFSPYLYKTLSIEDENQLQYEKRKIVKLTYLIMLVLLLGGGLFILLSKLILTAFFSQEYYNAVEYVNWAILSQIFQAYYVLFVNYIFFSKKNEKLAAITISCGVLQVLLSYLLVKIIGPLGAAYSSVIIAFINFLVVMLFSQKVYPMPWASIFIAWRDTYLKK
ncbi:lipopolysaccharide biosynthesis protein [Sphingobacterium detergens]|uniref:lipopolysaccharide biosynthesis protein n=1 Tax=Sphingobacterium detergens TaxID=1145106 RepID=UPI003AAB79F6